MLEEEFMSSKAKMAKETITMQEELEYLGKFVDAGLKHTSFSHPIIIA